MLKKNMSFILTLVTLISTSIMVYAKSHVENVGGGTWIWGVAENCFSKYQHPHLYHGSTAVNGNGDRSAPDKISPGKESNASVIATKGHLFNGNKAFWHRCNIDKECGGPYNRNR